MAFHSKRQRQAAMARMRTQGLVAALRAARLRVRSVQDKSALNRAANDIEKIPVFARANRLLARHPRATRAFIGALEGATIGMATVLGVSSPFGAAIAVPGAAATVALSRRSRQRLAERVTEERIRRLRTR